MKPFDELPKSMKKTLRYINQDVQSIETLEHIEKIMGQYIQRRKKQLIASRNMSNVRNTLVEVADKL